MLFKRLIVATFVISLLPAAVMADDEARGLKIGVDPEAGNQFVPPSLERYGDPFLPSLYQNRFAPPAGGGSSIYGQYRSVQVNVGAVGQAANEPSMAINPLNPLQIAVGWRQFDNVASNFRQAGYGYSSDGGKTWTFPGNIQPGVFRSDPVLLPTAAGSVYYLSLQLSFYDDEFSSSNGGKTWNDVGPAEGGDKEWMAIDRIPGTGQGNIYQAWSTAGNNYGGAQFTRSVDGGRTWMAPIFMPNQPIWGTLDVGLNHEVYVGGWDGSQFRVNRSSNANNPYVAPTFDQSSAVNLGGQMIYAGYVNPGGLSGQAWTVVDKSNSPTIGNVYMLCSVYVDASDPCDVMFACSRDGGKTFDPPVRINDDAVSSGHSHWFGALSVSPTGRIDVVWNDTRDDPSSNTSALYFSTSSDGGATWTKNVRVSQSWSQFVGYPDQNKMGDYIEVSSDASGANVAYTATFNGEENIYFLRIPATPTTYKPTSVTLTEGQRSAGNVQSLYYVDANTYDTLSGYLPGYGQYAGSKVNFLLDGHASAFQSLALSWTCSGPLAATTQVFAYDYATNRYDVIKAQALLGYMKTFTAQLSNYSDYVNPATNEMQFVVRAFIPARLEPTPFLYKVDQVQVSGFKSN